METDIITEVSFCKAIERELRTGFELQRQTEIAREKQAADQAKDAAGAVLGRNGLELRKIASIPSKDYFQIIRKYGVEAFTDNEFLGDFRKRKKHLTTAFCPERPRMVSVSR